MTTQNQSPPRTSLSYFQSFTQYFTTPSQEKTQDRVLRLLPFYPHGDKDRSVTASKVDIGDDLYINEVEIVNPPSKGGANIEPKKTLVMLHGYGAGLAFYFRNLDALSTLPESRLLAVDLLGFGLSSRPSFKIQTQDVAKRNEKGEFLAVKETEDWFVESLEKYRVAKKLDTFTLLGHSFGGYLAAAYAFRYPSRVEKLIMVSPAGVERGYNESLDVKALFRRSVFQATQEPNKDATSTASIKPKSSSSESLRSSQGHRSEPLETSAETPRERTPSDLAHDVPDDLMLQDPKASVNRNMPNWAMYMWNSHISPFYILRWSTVFGPKLISSWSFRRFAELSSQEMDALHSYCYKTFMAKASGELGLTRILAPGALARMPLVDRVASNLKCPSLWLYGDKDWMNSHAGDEAVRRLNHLKSQQTNATFVIVPQAGHHVYLDNPSTFNDLVLKFLKS